MEVARDTLCAGLLTKSSRWSLSYPRKILFSFDLVSQTGYDIINDCDFPVHKKGNEKKFYISCVQPLGNNLKELGYPEVLEDVHIEHMMEKDFEKIFLESNIIQNLYVQSMDKLNEFHSLDNYKYLKKEFKKSSFEIREEAKKRNRLIKKGWF